MASITVEGYYLYKKGNYCITQDVTMPLFQSIECLSNPNNYTQL